jgi:hypothetical protein
VQVLQKEVQRRTGILWVTTDRVPLDATPVIVLTGPLEGHESWTHRLPMAAPTCGVRLYAVGWLLRKLELWPGSVLRSRLMELWLLKQQ